jgi:hypothetical protein
MRNSILMIISALALGGCAGGQTDQGTTPPGTQPEHAQGHGMHGQGHGHGMHGHGKEHGMHGHAHMAEMCPVQVQGTTARAEDVEGGAALVFTTTTDVAELRRRVAHMAEMHAQHHGQGHAEHGDMHGAGHAGHAGQGHAEHGDMHGAGHAGHAGQGHAGHGDMHGDSHALMAKVQAKAEETDGGARLVITFVDAAQTTPADLDMLRQHVRDHAQQISSGTCPMMSKHGGPDTGAQPAPAGNAAGSPHQHD